MNPDDVDPVALGVLLSTLPPGHILVTAARLGIEVGARRAGVLLDDDYIGGRFHRQHVIGISRLQKLRWPPNGDREEWIRHGPSGPPAALSEAA